MDATTASSLSANTIIFLLPTIFLLLVLIILLRPTQYNPYDPSSVVSTSSNPESTKAAISSQDENYATFSKHSNPKALQPTTSVTILVLGDIGRSPRMQYHTLSLLSHGAHVNLVGYIESALLPSLLSSEYVTRLKVHALNPIPPFLATLGSRYTWAFAILAPLKAIDQCLTLFTALAYTCTASKYILIQNPPAIPVLAISILVSRLRNSQLVIDWHNLGYSLLALRFPRQRERHPLVRLARAYEYSLARFADVHLTVTEALAKHLSKQARLTGFQAPRVLHDRPAELFQPYFSPTYLSAKGTEESREDFLGRLETTAPYANRLCAHGSRKKMRLLISPTSWTQDEDIGLLLSALISYSSTISPEASSTGKPDILTIITGTGPTRRRYLDLFSKLASEGKLRHTPILTAFLPSEDYAKLLSAADLGISLHTSSSGMDLPMKVLDMFGSGTPVAGFGEFKAWSELVREGKGGNGVGFATSEQLAKILGHLFGEEGESELEELTSGALEEGRRRWNGEWDRVTKSVFFE